MTNERLKKQLIRHEGLRLKPYRCPAGRLTIGCGRNLEDRGISKVEAMAMLDHDILAARGDLDAILDQWGISRWRLNRARRDALANVVFNIGRSSLSGFKRMWVAVKSGQWDRAAAELLDSRYALEVGRRAVELAEQLRTGQYQNER